MNKTVRFSDKANKDLKFFQKSGNKAILKKINEIIEDIANTPYSGIGKPEALKYDLAGFWSRRIDKEHRVVYEVLEKDNIARIISLKGHYEKRK